MSELTLSGHRLPLDMALRKVLKTEPSSGGVSTLAFIVCWCKLSEIKNNHLQMECLRPITYITNFLSPTLQLLSPPWPSRYKHWNQTLVPVVRARFEPRCGRSHFAPTRSGVRVCGRNRTEARDREWAEGTVSSLPGMLNVRIKFCHSTGIERSCGWVRASTISYA